MPALPICDIIQGKGAVKMERQNSQFEVEHISFEESAAGKQFAELQKLRQELEQHISEQASYQAAAEQREKSAEKRGFWRGILAGIIGSSVAGLFLYYWPNIIDLISSLVQ